MDAKLPTTLVFCEDFVKTFFTSHRWVNRFFFHLYLSLPPVDRSSLSCDRIFLMDETKLLLRQLLHNNYPLGSLISILLLSLFMRGAVASTSPADAKIGDCAPVACSGINVSYPFWVTDRQPSYCGFPEFELTCGEEGDRPLLHLRDQFYVKQIYYENHSLWVANSSLATASCPFPDANLTIPFSLLNISSANRELFFFRNCTFPDHSDRPSSRAPCDKDTTFAYLGLDYWTWERPAVLSDACHSPSLVVPVFLNQTSSPTTTDDYLALVKEGFLLEWRLAEDCPQCRASTGECGYDSDRESFMCICPDRPHSTSCSKRKTKSWVKIVGVIGSSAFVICIFSLYTILARKKNKRGFANIRDRLEATEGENLELPLYTLSTISTATENFSFDNKLGEGGFGPVYKGMLFDVQVAVKRLSRSSAQGLEEFKSEIQLLAKLQHTNLVKILGCCIEAEEKIVVYEYMKNGSLDKYLFDPHKRAVLDWHKRVHIIEGITQGLLYLHKYSRLRVIHRDLKASNILLDADINPKISDFGMARIFSLDKSQINTNRIVGTYGYMSPEYAMEGLFSIKSDVFSFGVLLLEILSGKRNVSHNNHGFPQNLIGYAWELLTQGKEVELMDISLGETCPTQDLSRYVKVALLCVQEFAVDRPTIADVSYMLNNQSMTLPTPKQPAFFLGSRNANQEMQIPCSNNCLSLSLIDGR